MESGVKVALPAAVAEARLMGSAEGFGGGGGGGGVVVTEVQWRKEGACSSGGRKDDLNADNTSEPHWNMFPDPELSAELCQPSSSLQLNDLSNDSGFLSTNAPVVNPVVDTKPVLQKSCKIIRDNSGCNKKSGVVQMEICKSEPGISPEIASSSVCYSISEKVQMVKQKGPTSRRGDKRNSKVKHKSRCDAFSLKNGLVVFNSAAGGNNFYGIYGLKPDAFDITKYVNELSLDELLHGNCSCPSVVKDQAKKAANSNDNTLQSIRKACSVLQFPRGLQVQDCAEIDDTCTQKFSTSLIPPVSPGEGQADADKTDICSVDLTSSDKVQESDCKIKKFNIAESQLYHPKDVLERLALPLSVDLDSLLSDSSKTTTVRNSTDSRLGKPILNRTGLPPFPWSHPFSTHSKLNSDAIKSSTSRAICQGRWMKVNNSPALQKSCTDLLADFGSLTFNQSLVPSFNLTIEHPDDEAAPIERVMSTSNACSTSMIPADDYSQKCAAAQTLLDIALKSQRNSCTAVKLLKKPSRVAMKVSKVKGVERTDVSFNVPKPIKPTYPSKTGDDGFPSKKLKLSSVVTDTHIGRSEPTRKGLLPWSASPMMKSSPRKLFRDSGAGMDDYASNYVRKSITTKPPRGTERPGSSSSSSIQKFRKLSH